MSDAIDALTAAGTMAGGFSRSELGQSEIYRSGARITTRVLLTTDTPRRQSEMQAEKSSSEKEETLLANAQTLASINRPSAVWRGCHAW